MLSRFKEFYYRSKITVIGQLRNRIILTVLLAITIPTIFFLLYIFSFVNGHLYDNYVESILTQSTRHMEDILVANLRLIDNSANILASNQGIRDNLYIIANDEPTYYKEQLVKLNIETELKYIMGSDFAFNKNLINSIVLVSDHNHYYYLLSNYLPNQTLIDSVLNIYERNISDNDSIQYYKESDTIYYIKSINDYISQEELGKLIIGINPDMLSGEYEPVDTDGGFGAVIDSNGEYWFHTTPQLIGSKADESIMKNIFSGKASEINYDNQSYLIQAKHINDLNLYIVNYITTKFFLKDFRSIIPIYLNFSILSILISLLVGIYSVSHVTEPLKKITQTIADVSDTEFKEKMPSYKYKELNDLSIVYNKMIDKIQYLFTEVYEKQILVRESELRALHAQINPHFIFNVLETITWEARMSDNEKIERMVTSLAQLLRSSLSFTHQEKHSIGQELEHVSFYLYLQTIRFVNRISYNIEFESDDLLECYLPKFAIQTLVENSIIHGIESKTEHSHIIITVKPYLDDLFISVEDDGIGFNSEELSLDAQHSDSTSASDHVGLRNVNQRIKLLYGNNYRLSIKSVYGKGTIATIYIPKDKENQ